MDTLSETQSIELVKPAEFSERATHFASKKEEVAKEIKRHIDGPNEILCLTDV